MGGGNWSGDAYKDLTTSQNYATKSRRQIFSNDNIMDEMNPKGLKVRESRDSDNHPNSLAIIIALDETGSMGEIPEKIARHKLITLMNILVNNKVEDAHVLFCGIGDHYSDSSPLQVGQFEAEGELLNKWLTGIFLEGNGGGQQKESYLLAWLLAARHTSIDCFEKRNQKGFLFTIGDEACHPQLDVETLKRLLGYEIAENVSDEKLFEEASKMYNIYHIHCQEGSYPNDDEIFSYWKNLLGERFYVIDNIDNICEVIASTIAVQMGANLDKIVESLDNDAALVVRSTVGGLAQKKVNGVVDL